MRLNSFRALVAVLVFGSALATAADVSYVNGRSPGDQGPPFSGAVWVDDILYVSGALGLVNGEVPEDPADEARAVMDSIKRSIEAAGLTMDEAAGILDISPRTADSVWAYAKAWLAAELGPSI